MVSVYVLNFIMYIMHILETCYSIVLDIILDIHVLFTSVVELLLCFCASGGRGHKEGRKQ